MAVRRIVVACGSGVATSNMVADRLRRLLRDKGLWHIDVRAVDVRSLSTELASADLLLSIAPYAQGSVAPPVPVLSGIPLLTGVGASQLVDQIVAMARTDAGGSGG